MNYQKFEVEEPNKNSNKEADNNMIKKNIHLSCLNTILLVIVFLIMLV